MGFGFRSRWPSSVLHSTKIHTSHDPTNNSVVLLMAGRKLFGLISLVLDANGTYLLLNMTSAKLEEVKLETTVLNGFYCVRFFYYMYGADTDDLKVTVQSIYNSSDITEYFSHRKPQGDRWKEAQFFILPLSAWRLRAYRGEGAKNRLQRY
ncbi:MAM and LDL-receptor class A domain-containing protein 2 [Trichonephila clavipes]|nr:MAM and LDL-receptor class A domain-containing protein 2 [Trichonephila clavipes]